MNSILSQEQIKERKNARVVLYGESVFVILPFIIMITIAYRDAKLGNVIYSPEWSLASIILFGQTLVRFSSGLFKYRGKLNWQKASLWVILILSLTVFSTVVYIIQLDNPSKLSFAITQLTLFIISLACFIVFGGIGQILLDKQSKISQKKP